MAADSQYYVQRSVDAYALQMVRPDLGVTCAIRGPRQVGKSSLTVRLMESFRTAGKTVVFIDFQAFDSSSLRSSAFFFRSFIASVCRQLKLTFDIDEFWKQELGGQDLCVLFFESFVVPKFSSLALVMDEVDRLFESEFSRDFFATLRYWHNARATGGFGSRMDLVLVAASEPRLFIPNPNESPFNLGEVLKVSDFNEGEVATLDDRYDAPFRIYRDELYALLSGHPFLTHAAIYHAAAGIASPDKLLQESDWEKGPFGDHLRNFENRLYRDGVLRETFYLALKGRRCEPVPFDRLSEMGLVAGTAGRPRMRCELYRRYYGSR